MIQTVSWLLQFVALVVVGTGLLVGLFYGALRTEIALMALGGLMFLVGRKLGKS